MKGLVLELPHSSSAMETSAGFSESQLTTDVAINHTIMLVLLNPERTSISQSHFNPTAVSPAQHRRAQVLTKRKEDITQGLCEKSSEITGYFQPGSIGVPLSHSKQGDE